MPKAVCHQCCSSNKCVVQQTASSCCAVLGAFAEVRRSSLRFDVRVILPICVGAQLEAPANWIPLLIFATVDPFAKLPVFPK